MSEPGISPTSFSVTAGAACNRLTIGQKSPSVDPSGWSTWTSVTGSSLNCASKPARWAFRFRIDYRKGKGGHAMVFVGDRLTTLTSREIDRKTARKIKKQLGLAD